MSNSYEILEKCLQAVERGADPETILSAHPDLASELRPMLEAARLARSLRAGPPPEDVVRRGRARLINRAAGLRTLRRPGSGAAPLVRRLATVFVLSAVFLLSGTGLVNASSGSLPGEGLYPVKRTWEDLRLLFIFNNRHREAVEGEYENERLEEVQELIQRERQVTIAFTGVVAELGPDRLVVSGVTVELSGATQFSGGPLGLGSAVVIVGHTQPGQVVSADSVQTLPPGTLVPTGKQAVVVQFPGENSPRTFQLEGRLESIQGIEWTVNGRTVIVENVQIPAGTAVGSVVEVEGYFSTDGLFIATGIELEHENESGDGPGGDEEHEEDEAGLEGQDNPEEDDGGEQDNSGQGTSGDEDRTGEEDEDPDSGEDHSGPGGGGDESDSGDSDPEDEGDDGDN